MLSPTTATVENVEVTVPIASGGHGTVLVSFGASTAAKIEKATLVNNDTVAHAITLGIGPASGVSTATTWFLNQYILGAQTSLPLGDYLEGLWLGDGDCIFGLVDTGTEVQLLVSATVFA